MLLKFKWVDCENWDLFAVMEGRQRPVKGGSQAGEITQPMVSAEYRRRKARQTEKKGQEIEGSVTSIEDAAAGALRTHAHASRAGRSRGGPVAVYQKSSRSLAGWQPQESDWVNLIQALSVQNAWSDAALVMRDYVKRSPRPSPRIR